MGASRGGYRPRLLLLLSLPLLYALTVKLNWETSTLAPSSAAKATARTSQPQRQLQQPALHGRQRQPRRQPAKPQHPATAAPDPRCAGIERPVASASQYSRVPAPGVTPQLFDVSRMPSLNTTCAHCASPDEVLFCCGVCVFEHRLCSEHWKDGYRRVSQRAQAQILKDGHPLWELTPCELFQRIRGRTLWFMGDSQSWHFYIAVECFLHEFAVDYQRRNVTDDPEKRIRLRPVTVSVERYALCLQMVEDTRLCVIRADDAWAMVRDIWPTMRTLGRDLTRDIMVYNFGLHHPPAEDVFGAQLTHAGDYITANSDWLPAMVWMDTPPQHFNTYSGMYAHDRPKLPCVRLENHTITQEGGKWGQLAAKHLDRLGVAHLAIWHATVPLHYTHLNSECTHFCSPGPYQLWTFLLNKLMREKGLGNPVETLGQQKQQQGQLALQQDQGEQLAAQEEQLGNPDAASEGGISTAATQ